MTADPVSEKSCDARHTAETRLVDERIEKLEASISHLTERFDLRLSAADKALTIQAEANERALRIQAQEYERRLGELNNAHERALAEQSRTMSRNDFVVFSKEYDQFRASFDEFRRKTEANHAAMLAATTKGQEIARTWATAIGILVSILAVLLRFWQ